MKPFTLQILVDVLELLTVVEQHGCDLPSAVVLSLLEVFVVGIIAVRRRDLPSFSLLLPLPTAPVLFIIAVAAHLRNGASVRIQFVRGSQPRASVAVGGQEAAMCQSAL